jgi:tetratricopeptide (TPR) repeat protein
MMYLAHLLYFVGRYAECEPLYIRALDIQREALGSDHPVVGDSAWQLARLYHLRPEFNRNAELLYTEALAISEQQHGAEGLKTAERLYRLADFYRGQGRAEEAEPLYRRSMQALDGHPEASGISTDWMRSGFAEFLRETGRAEEADEREARREAPNPHEEMLRAEVMRREASYGADHPATAESLYTLANSRLFEADYAEAEDLYRRSLAIREQAFGKEDRQVVENLNGLVRLYRAQGLYAEALPIADRALAIHEAVSESDSDEHARAGEQGACARRTERVYAREQSVRSVYLRLSYRSW